MNIFDGSSVSSIPVDLKDITVEEVENLFKKKYQHKINAKGILENSECGKEKVHQNINVELIYWIRLLLLCRIRIERNKLEYF